MRQNNHNKQNQQRSRSRGRGKPQNPLTRNFESSGPDVKVRGNAQTIADKYQQLARDAQSSGDTVLEQSYLQHAEHYLRMIAASHGNQSSPQRQINENQARESQPVPPENVTNPKSLGGNGTDPVVKTNPVQQTENTDINKVMDDNSYVPETKSVDEFANLSNKEESFPTSSPIDSNRVHTPRGRGVRRVAVTRDRSEPSLSQTAS